ncbi:MAG: hypothetical protein R3C59_21680 [Planctomycetaceae bacterium]
MSLTVKEKEHWKERIARRIDHAVEELQSNEDPGFYERIHTEADEEAWTTLGLKALRDEQRDNAKAQSELRKREQQIYREMYARVSGVPIEDVGQQYSTPIEVQRAIKRRRDVHVREFLSTTILGQRILQLQQEKEELLDTVWLATSPSQIKELWSRFSDLLNWQPPQLQKDALSIQPPATDS